jgi:hypothetical protein
MNTPRGATCSRALRPAILPNLGIPLTQVPQHIVMPAGLRVPIGASDAFCCPCCQRPEGIGSAGRSVPCLFHGHRACRGEGNRVFLACLHRQQNPKRPILQIAPAGWFLRPQHVGEPESRRYPDYRSLLPWTIDRDPVSGYVLNKAIRPSAPIAIDIPCGGVTAVECATSSSGLSRYGARPRTSAAKMFATFCRRGDGLTRDREGALC